MVGVLWAAAMFAWFFLAALYLQQVLGYSALEVGLAFVPTSLVMMFCSLKVSDRLVMTFGIRAPLTVGLALAAVSLALFAMAPVDGSYVTDVLPSMVLLGIGAGIAFNPVLLAAMGDVEPHEAGLASGVVNTSFMMGGALGLAVLVAVSDSRTASLAAGGSSAVEALHGGLQVAFAVGAVAAALAAVVGGVFLRPQPMAMPEWVDPRRRRAATSATARSPAPPDSWGLSRSAGQPHRRVPRKPSMASRPLPSMDRPATVSTSEAAAAGSVPSAIQRTLTVRGSLIEVR